VKGGVFMALVKYGGGIVGASGSIAGTVHARNRFGNYIRARTKPVNPNSTAQAQMRGILAQLANAWGVTLIAAERIAWATYAAAIAVKNRLGETVYLTGFNHFIACNSIRLSHDKTVKTAGPTTLILPETDPTFAVVATASDNKLTFNYDTTLPWFTEEGAMMTFEQGQPQPVTRNFFNGPWKKVGQAVTGIAKTTKYTAPYTLTAGQKVWCYARIARADARLSNPMVCSVTVAA
jgi:hypothetical protein